MKKELRRNRDSMGTGSKRELGKNCDSLIEDLNNATHQLDLRNIYGILHRTTTEYVCEKGFRLESQWGDYVAYS